MISKWTCNIVYGVVISALSRNLPLSDVYYDLIYILHIELPRTYAVIIWSYLLFRFHSAQPDYIIYSSKSAFSISDNVFKVFTCVRLIENSVRQFKRTMLILFTARSPVRRNRDDKHSSRSQKNVEQDILCITNLVRPFTLTQLKELLQRTGKIVRDGFWIDSIKSKCYVQVKKNGWLYLLGLIGIIWYN